MKTYLLTKRERQVLELFSREFQTDQNAIELYISFHTVKTHRKNLLQKLNAKNVAGMIRKGFELENLSA